MFPQIQPLLDLWLAGDAPTQCAKVTHLVIGVKKMFEKKVYLVLYVKRGPYFYFYQEFFKFLIAFITT
jgi:hypothetical protein